VKSHAINFRTIALAAAIACWIGWLASEGRADTGRLDAPSYIVNSAPAVLRGRATFYADKYVGQVMANGRIYRHEGFTCACWWFPLGAVLEVSSAGRSVYVVNTDRGPAWWAVEANEAVIDLTPLAYDRLFTGRLQSGRKVNVRRVK